MHEMKKAGAVRLSFCLLHRSQSIFLFSFSLKFGGVESVRFKLHRTLACVEPSAFLPSPTGRGVGGEGTA